MQAAAAGALWHGSFKTAPGRVVLVRDPGSGKDYDLGLFTLDPEADPAAIAERYSWRWPIEPSSATGKQILGVGDACNRVEKAVERTVPFGFLVQSLLITWYEDVPAFVELESGGPPPVACRVVGVGRLPSHPTKEGDRREQDLSEERPPCRTRLAAGGDHHPRAGGRIHGRDRRVGEGGPAGPGCRHGDAGDGRHVRRGRDAAVRAGRQAQPGPGRVPARHRGRVGHPGRAAPAGDPAPGPGSRRVRGAAPAQL